MKFTFRPSTAKRRLKSPQEKRKNLKLRGINTLRTKKEKGLIPNYRAEDFGIFGQEKKRGRFSLLTEKIRIKLKKLFKSKKKQKSELISSATLLGALCSALSLTLISGAVVIFSLFFRHSGKYTEITIPDLTAMSAQKATETSNDIFEYTLVYEENPTMKAGSVISQSPLPNVVRKLYGKSEKINITLTVNKEEQTMEMPRAVGTQLRETALKLKNFGANVQVVEQYSETVPYGMIFFSSLPQGSKISAGQRIILKASIGKQPRYSQAPNLYGLSEYEAAALLKSKNLSVGDIKYESSKLPIGTVISQDIAPDTTLSEGSKISFTLSGGIYY